jgi:hypothetical protein
MHVVMFVIAVRLAGAQRHRVQLHQRHLVVETRSDRSVWRLSTRECLAARFDFM